MVPTTTKEEVTVAVNENYTENIDRIVYSGKKNIKKYIVNTNNQFFQKLISQYLEIVIKNRL